MDDDNMGKNVNKVGQQSEVLREAARYDFLSALGDIQASEELAATVYLSSKESMMAMI